jgi:hypothetical protein
MLSSSHPKIHEPLAVGVSPPPTDQRQRQNCETRVALWVPETLHTPSDLLLRRYRRPGMIPRWRCD